MGLKGARLGDGPGLGAGGEELTAGGDAAVAVDEAVGATVIEGAGATVGGTTGIAGAEPDVSRTVNHRATAAATRTATEIASKMKGQR